MQIHDCVCKCSHAFMHLGMFPYTPTQLTVHCPVGRVFANGPGDRVSIPGGVIPKTFKEWYLIPPCLTLCIIRCVSRVK